ncbi:MAG TPA: hypothetical protein VFB54_05005 [Burkholderiales bacterium]|nr:hypothetical protein [Burkholderiales bacterium]
MKRLGTLVLVAFALAAGANTAARAEEPQCPAGDGYIDCMAKAGDKMAMYVQGRDAYEAARQSGDFTEALRIARQLAKANDKNGERLLKMVHLQLGWGAHRDLVQGYVWLTEDLPANDYTGTLRKNLAEKMSAEQLSQARARVKE